MMIPTNYLRYARSRAAKYDGSPPTLQQWWAKSKDIVIEHGKGAVTTIFLERPDIGEGEWRDVETVEGA